MSNYQARKTTEFAYQLAIKHQKNTYLLFVQHVLINRYNGPGSQSVTSEWHFDWDTYMGSAKDFVIATADVRGSSGNGAAFNHAVHRQIGEIETKDYIHIIK